MDPAKPAPQGVSIKIYHELMARKVERILLVSSPYDAFIMEEEGRLSNRIIHEYKGLNLSKPPRLTWVSSAQAALEKLTQIHFDMVIAMPSMEGMDIHSFGEAVKEAHADLPLFMLLHNTCDQEQNVCIDPGTAIDRLYMWRGNADLLLAMIKSLEDEMNVAFDTENAKVRVIIMVEDSPQYYSTILPVIYRQIVLQTQKVIDDSINEEHRILKMRGRTKVLLAHNYEEALALFQKYREYVLSVFSDMRFPRGGRPDALAGHKLLKQIKSQAPDLPVLVLSTEEMDPKLIEEIPAVFIHKNSNNLNNRIKSFFINHLGFGDFVFRTPEGEEIARAVDLEGIERLVSEIPDDAVMAHARNNDFSRWLMARSEIDFALKLKPYGVEDFDGAQALKRFLMDCIREKRRGTRRGQVIDFTTTRFDADTDFMKIGSGSLGGKARGLAFLASQMGKDPCLQKAFPDVDISIPQTLIIATDGFKAFVEANQLNRLLEQEAQLTDEQVVTAFVEARFPDELKARLRTYLEHVRYPLAVRSSSLFEDAHYQPFAGLYQTYMLPNSHPNTDTRLEQLILAMKRVYASTYMAAPRAYAKNTQHRTEDEEMAIVLQQIKGTKYKNYFYPAVSGVVQSYNFYPLAHLKAEEGIAHIALGMGKIVMEGEKTLRLCPKYPQFLPQFSMVKDILDNAQTYFYALKTDTFPEAEAFCRPGSEDATLAKLDLTDTADHPVVRSLCSTFYPQDNRIRDAFSPKGFPVLTFARILKYDDFPLAELLDAVSQAGSRWMGTSVELEFAINLPVDGQGRPEFSLLQIRPMGQYKKDLGITITEDDVTRAFCYSTRALGNGTYEEIQDLILVDPEAFDPAKTVDVAGEINTLNAQLQTQGRKYVLMGPGRWGSSDRWLGIPVVWNDISNVGVIVETTIDSIKADPSQGSHFFQNITSLGISYITVSDRGEDFIHYPHLDSDLCQRTTYLKHIRFNAPLKILVDGRSSRAVMIQNGTTNGDETPMSD